MLPELRTIERPCRASMGTGRMLETCLIPRARCAHPGLSTAGPAGLPIVATQTLMDRAAARRGAPSTSSSRLLDQVRSASAGKLISRSKTRELLHLLRCSVFDVQCSMFVRAAALSPRGDELRIALRSASGTRSPRRSWRRAGRWRPRQSPSASSRPGRG